ncbi:MAG TPA: MmgE/PrpD family protein, partial [Burkholderiales bacterium]|nr:MmgE/PrpD family protein [Burkholderiales bacterium]
MKPESLRTTSRTQDLLEFIHGYSVNTVPASAIESAKWCLLDCLGCALFGCEEPWARIMAEEMLAEGSTGRSSIVGQRRTVAAPA